MLHYDVIGFQSLEWLESFLHYCRKEHGAEVDEDSGTVRIGDRSTIARAFPIGIDHDEFMALGETEIARRSPHRLGGSARKRTIAIGVDRPASTQGLPDRIDAPARARTPVAPGTRLPARLHPAGRPTLPHHHNPPPPHPP